jgi:hypothetical protein
MMVSREPVLTDRIYAIATVSPESSKAVGVTHPRPIAVLGEKHTYIIGLGSDDIVKLANIAKANLPKGTLVFKDDQTLYLDGDKVSGYLVYEVVGAYSTSVKLSGVAINPAPTNGLDVQSVAKTIHFYRAPAPQQTAPSDSVAGAVLKAPLVVGAFLLWGAVDLTSVATGKH